MINSEERFFNYLHNKLNDSEKLQFEEDLVTDKKFAREFQEYQKIARLISDSKKVKLNEDYINNVIPVFRERISERSSTIIKPVIGFAISLIIMIMGYLTVIQMKSNNAEDLKFTERISVESEIESYLDYFDIPGKGDFGDYKIPEIDSVYKNNMEENIRNSLTQDHNNGNEIFADLSFAEIEEILSDQQMDELYSQLLETKFTRGSK